MVNTLACFPWVSFSLGSVQGVNYFDKSGRLSGIGNCRTLRELLIITPDRATELVCSECE